MKLVVLLDTNILVSALLFGGNSQTVLEDVLTKQLVGIISPILLAELSGVLSKKFPQVNSAAYIRKVKNSFLVVNPSLTISIQKDDPDNRVLEAAITGRCNYIITGDKELLGLGKYKYIKIVSPAQFLETKQY